MTGLRVRWRAEVVKLGMENFRAHDDPEVDTVIIAFCKVVRADPDRVYVMQHCLNRDALRTVRLLGDLNAVFSFLVAENKRIGPMEKDVG